MAAWEPELPPLEMMRGTNRARTTARWISCSKKPMAVAVSISPRNSTTSQLARGGGPWKGSGICEVRLVQRLHAAEALEGPGGRRLGDVQHVVDGDDADQRAVGIGDGQGDAVLALEEREPRIPACRWP